MKRIVSLILAAGLALLMGGCSGGKSEATNLSPNEVAHSLMEQLTFPEELLAAEGAAVGNYYKLDDSIAEHAIYVSSSGGTANEVAVLKVSDPSKVQDAKQILKRRVSDLKFMFEDYVPAEMTKLGDPVIETKGDLAVLILSNDSAAARKALKIILG